MTFVACSPHLPQFPLLPPSSPSPFCALPHTLISPSFVRCVLDTGVECFSCSCDGKLKLKYCAFPHFRSLLSASRSVPTKLKKFHYHRGNQSFLTAHQPSLSYDLTSCWTLWAVHQLKAPSPTPPRHHTTPHTHSHNFSHSCCLSFPLAALSSRSVLNTDTCSIYNSLALKEPFWTGSCPLPTPDRGFCPKRQHPPPLHLLPLEQACWVRKRRWSVCVCVCACGGLKISHPTLSAPGLGPCVCFSPPRPTHILYTLTH